MSLGLTLVNSAADWRIVVPNFMLFALPLQVLSV